MDWANGHDVLYQRLAGVLAHLLNLFAAAPGAHGAGVVVVVLLLLHLDVGAVARDYDGAAGLSAAQARAGLQHGVWLALVRVADGRRGRRGGHVVWIRGALSSSRVGRDGSEGLEGHFRRCGSGCSAVGEPGGQEIGRHGRCNGRGWVPSRWSSGGWVSSSMLQRAPAKAKLHVFQGSP